MTGRMPENLRGRLTPLMMRNSFSRLNESSLNRTGDSGYQSSFASLSRSFTPSSDVSDSSRLYCSTPVIEDSVLTSRNSVILDPVLDTPVLSVHPIKTRYSEDRIPCQRRPLPVGEETDDRSADVLSCLIRNQTRPAIQHIFNYLAAEDLLRLCQVSVEFCRSVFDDQASLKRLSRFLISIHQNGENRTTVSHNNSRPFGGILRQIHNVMSTNLPSGTAWSIPSPLETIDLKSIPSQFQSLIGLTRSLSEHHYVTTCHACRCLVAARLQHPEAVECSNCSKPANVRRTIGGSRRVQKPKATLFSSFR